MAVNGENFDGLVARGNQFFTDFFCAALLIGPKTCQIRLLQKLTAGRYGGGRLPKLAILTGPPSRSGRSVDCREMATRAHARAGTV